MLYICVCSQTCTFRIGKILVLGSRYIVCSNSDNLFLLPKVKSEMVPMVPLPSLEGICITHWQVER